MSDKRTGGAGHPNNSPEMVTLPKETLKDMLGVFMVINGQAQATPDDEQWTIRLSRGMVLLTGDLLEEVWKLVGEPGDDSMLSNRTSMSPERLKKIIRGS